MYYSDNKICKDRPVKHNLDRDQESVISFVSISARLLCSLHPIIQDHSWYHQSTDCGSVIEKWNLLSLEKSDKRKDLLIECSHFGGIRFNLCTMGDKLFKKLAKITNKRKSHHVLQGTFFITVTKQFLTD